MADEKKKNRSVEPTVMEWSRYLVLDRCLRDQHRYYHMEDLVKAVNRMLERYDFYPVSDHTIKSDLKFMQSGEGFGAVLAKRYDGHLMRNRCGCFRWTLRWIFITSRWCVR